MVTLGWILTGVGVVFIVIGLALGVLTIVKDLFMKQAQGGINANAIPGLSDLLKELIKTPWGLIAATGLVLVLIGLTLLGVKLPT